MGEHNTWWDYLPGYQNLVSYLQGPLGRKWRFMMFQDSHFTLSHVFSVALVFVFLCIGAIAYNRAMAKGGRDAIVPPPRWSLRNLMETFTEAIFSTMVGVMGEKNARKYLKLVGTLAFFIFFANLLALIPGFAPPTDTLKTNVALSLVVFVMTHVYGVWENGIGYFKHFLGPKLYLAPLMLPIEIVSHLARPVSLALRLMGNMLSDHKVVFAFFALVPLLLPVPFMLLGLMVVIVQTLLFTLLTMVYISMAVAHHDHEEHEEGHGHGDAAHAH